MTQSRWLIYFGNFRISETVITSWIIIAGLALVSFLLTRNLKKVPTSKVQIMLEFVIVTIANLVRDTMSEEVAKKMPNMVPYIGSLFFFFVCSNLTPLIGLRSPTTDLDTTLAWALTTVAMIYVSGVKYNGIGYFKHLFEPSPLMFPLHLIGEFARPVSLSFRPFGNILGGSIIMVLFYQLLGYVSTLISGLEIPFAQFLIPVPLHLYFDIFAGILQAFIFIMLTMAFVGMAAEEHSAHAEL